MRILALPLIALLAMLALLGCSPEKPQIDSTPLPTVASAPYICDHIPLRAVELMTGVRDPLVRGHFDLMAADGIGAGVCTAYRRDGEREKVLTVSLGPGGHADMAKGQIETGTPPLPEIVPGGIGYYFDREYADEVSAVALLVRGKSLLIVKLDLGVKGRDNAADVLALMKLIAPRLITDASAPSSATPKE
jgi:hypothetical protein